MFCFEKTIEQRLHDLERDNAFLKNEISSLNNKLKQGAPNWYREHNNRMDDATTKIYKELLAKNRSETEEMITRASSLIKEHSEELKDYCFEEMAKSFRKSGRLV